MAHRSGGGGDADEAHEAKCLRCGRCCCKKIIIGETVFYTPFTCRYLDVETKLCTVYERRHELNPGCLSVEKGIERGVFPADCPYVRGIEGYVPPVEEWNAELFSGAVEELVDALELNSAERERFLCEARGAAAPGGDRIQGTPRGGEH